MKKFSFKQLQMASLMLFIVVTVIFCLFYIFQIFAEGDWSRAGIFIWAISASALFIPLVFVLPICLAILWQKMTEKENELLSKD